MSFEPQSLPNQLVIPSDLHAARQAEEQILQVVADNKYSPEDQFSIRLALEEAIVNAHKHGNHGDPSRKITLSYAIDHNRAAIRVRDDGDGFLPCRVPDPTSPDRLCVPTGRGIMLMRAYLDSVRYNEKGNEVELVQFNKG